MIYTVTFNPSLDYTVHMQVFRAGAINRVAREAVYPGGKGINVGIILHRLGMPVRLLGFVAGFTGAEIERLAVVAGCGCDFIRLDKGLSRINVKIGAGKTVLAGEKMGTVAEASEVLAETGAETAVNGLGPDITAEDLQLLLQQFETLGSDDILVLSGSIAKGLPRYTYRKILERMNGKQVRVVVDAEGELLTGAIPCHPFLIKPNKEELEEIFKQELRSDEDVAACAQKLRQQGARNVLVSLGSDGALLAGEDGKIYRCRSPKGTLVNSVGAGDSMVAGFLAGYERNGGNLSEALRYGIAGGSATAFKDWLAEREEIEALLAGI
ncbi:MAG: 1-phosphofructokinase family hexose kinase [Acidaminococcaceae bacterium]|nr:1-phosphofructokinase family hexose kinase [Acidaminococcaceae bacterium]